LLDCVENASLAGSRLRNTAPLHLRVLLCWTLDRAGPCAPAPV